MKKILATFLILAGSCFADYLGSWNIDDYVMITATTHQFSTGAAYAATGDVDIWIYEDDTDAQIVDQVMTAFDSITGLYKYKVQCTAAAGFEAGKHYTVLIQATVDGVAAITTHNFQIAAAVDAVLVSGATPASLSNGATTINTDASGNMALSSGAVNSTSMDSTATQAIWDAYDDSVLTANVTQWTGTSVATPDTAGYPKVTIKDGTGTGEIDTNAGAVVSVSTVTTLTGHTAQTGDTYALANGANGFANIKSDTAAILTDTAAMDTANELRTLLTGATTAMGNPDTITSAVWGASRASFTTDGTMGGDLLDADTWTDTRSGYLDSIPTILTDTGAMDTSTELRTLLYGSDTPGATAANQTTIIGYIDTEVAAILADTGAYDTDAEIAAAVWGALRASYNTASTMGQTINTTNTNIANLDQAISTTESNIRGADSDTLKTISDEIAALNDPAASEIVTALMDHALTGSYDFDDMFRGLVAVLFGESVQVDSDTYRFYDLDGETLRCTIDYGDDYQRTTITLVTD